MADGENRWSLGWWVAVVGLGVSLAGVVGGLSGYFIALSSRVGAVESDLRNRDKWADLIVEEILKSNKHQQTHITAMEADLEELTRKVDRYDLRLAYMEMAFTPIKKEQLE